MNFFEEIARAKREIAQSQRKRREEETKDLKGLMDTARDIMRRNNQVRHAIEEVRERVEQGDTIKAVVGSETIINAYKEIHEEELPDFLQGVETISSDMVGDKLIFIFDVEPEKDFTTVNPNGILTETDKYFFNTRYTPIGIPGEFHGTSGRNFD